MSLASQRLRQYRCPILHGLERKGYFRSAEERGGRREPRTFLLSPAMRLSNLFATTAPAATLLVRLLVGAVFFVEGTQKFLYPDALGAGRFAKIGIPSPEIMGPFVGIVEIVGGTLVILGLLTRPAALALLIDILVAIVTTKVPILLGHDHALRND